MNAPTVFIVDDDASVRDSLALLLKLRQLRTETFASAEEFLEKHEPESAGCLLLDVRMPGMSGLELQAELARRAIALPVIVITAHGDVATTRTALKAGAFDFLEKPVDDQLLFDVIENALDFDSSRRDAKAMTDAQRERLQRLTRREREVMELLADGRHNREIAESLGISPRTVEVYRARMMEKLQARNLADLIRIIFEARSADNR
ncbi:MAG TPA: response regulator [Gammaproteobacteria bacterium]